MVDEPSSGVDVADVPVVVVLLPSVALVLLVPLSPVRLDVPLESLLPPEGGGLGVGEGLGLGEGEGEGLGLGEGVGLGVGAGGAYCWNVHDCCVLLLHVQSCNCVSSTVVAFVSSRQVPELRLMITCLLKS